MSSKTKLEKAMHFWVVRPNEVSTKPENVFIYRRFLNGEVQNQGFGSSVKECQIKARRSAGIED